MKKWKNKGGMQQNSDETEQENQQITQELVDWPYHNC